MEIGLRIKQLRENNQISVTKLAKDTGLTQSFLWEVEAGQKNISFSNLEKICDYLGITLADFFTPNQENKQTLTQNRITQKVRLLNPEEAAIVISIIEQFLKNREANEGN